MISESRDKSQQHFNNQRFLKIASPYFRATKQINCPDRGKPRQTLGEPSICKQWFTTNKIFATFFRAGYQASSVSNTYYPSQDYGDDNNVDPEYRPSKKELKGADKEGDK